MPEFTMLGVRETASISAWAEAGDGCDSVLTGVGANLRGGGCGWSGDPGPPAREIMPSIWAWVIDGCLNGTNGAVVRSGGCIGRIGSPEECFVSLSKGFERKTVSKRVMGNPSV